MAIQQLAFEAMQSRNGYGSSHHTPQNVICVSLTLVNFRIGTFHAHDTLTHLTGRVHDQYHTRFDDWALHWGPQPGHH